MRCWSDEEICEGLRDPPRRDHAFRELHARFAPRLLGLLVRMCRGDRERAEDLLGQALYKAYKGLAQMEGPCHSLPAWLYTVTARTALDHIARTDRDDPLHAPLPLNDEIMEAPAPPPETERGATEAAVDTAVEAILARLDAEDPRYRTLLEMEHVAACDRGEMAEATGIPRKQLSQYLKRARERFVRLAREYPELAVGDREAVPGVRE